MGLEGFRNGVLLIFSKSDLEMGAQNHVGCVHSWDKPRHVFLKDILLCLRILIAFMYIKVNLRCDHKKIHLGSNAWSGNPTTVSFRPILQGSNFESTRTDITEINILIGASDLFNYFPVHNDT